MSVLNQTTPPGEIVVVDDGSSDGGADVAAGYLRSFDKLVRLDRNRGGAAARNIGIDAASFALIAFLDSDDEWLPNKLQHQLDILRDQPAGHRCLIYTNTLNISKCGERLANKCLLQDARHVSEYLLVDFQVIQTSTWLMTTSIAREIRFDESLRKHQDWDFVIRASSAGVAFVGTLEPLVRYNDTADAPRVSLQVAPMQTKNWLEKVKPIITPRAHATLSMALLFPNAVYHHPLDAVGYLIRALRFRIPLKRIAAPILLSTLPARMIRLVTKISRTR